MTEIEKKFVGQRVIAHGDRGGVYYGTITVRGLK